MLYSTCRLGNLWGWVRGVRGGGPLSCGRVPRVPRPSSAPAHRAVLPERQAALRAGRQRGPRLAGLAPPCQPRHAGPLLCGEGDAEAKKHSGLTVPQTCLLVDASLPRTGSPTDPIAIVDYRRARNAAARRANPSAQGGTASTCSGNMTFRCTTKSSRLTFLLRDLDQVAA